MPIWSDTDINRWIGDAQEDVASRVNCVYKRHAFSIVSGTPTYSLPSDFHRLLAVTWKGTRLEPLTQYEMKIVDPTYLTNSSTPEFYSCDGDGTDKIRFYPVPNVTIASTASNLFGTEIANRVILSYYAIPDATSILIPRWISRRMIKAFVLSKAFAVEGKGQKMRAATYFKAKYESIIKDFKYINDAVYMARIRTDINLIGGGVRRPLLPTNFGEDRYL